MSHNGTQFFLVTFSFYLITDFTDVQNQKLQNLKTLKWGLLDKSSVPKLSLTLPSSSHNIVFGNKT